MEYTAIYSRLVLCERCSEGSSLAVHGDGLSPESYRPIQRPYTRYCSDTSPPEGGGGVEGIYFNRLFPKPFPHNVPVVLFIQRPRFYTQSQVEALGAQVSPLGNCFLSLSQFILLVVVVFIGRERVNSRARSRGWVCVCVCVCECVWFCCRILKTVF